MCYAFWRFVSLFLVLFYSSLNVFSDKVCECEPRYLQHYSAKGCSAVYNAANPDCKCPLSYQCPTIQIDTKVCKLKGVSYEIGQPVETSNNCQICTCRNETLFNTGPTIDCIGIECGHTFKPPPNPERHCFRSYQEGNCCPNQICDVPKTADTPVCSYKNKEYRFGQRIYPEEDPCLICLCGPNWSGINNQSCYSFQCDLEKEIHNFKKGCIPIYHDKTCCPIEYHCPKSASEIGYFASEPEIPLNGSVCYFDHHYYNLGEILDIKHATNCVTCSCSTPPDFTCIHRSCPGPPNNDYVNCQHVFEHGICCPSFNCSQNLKPAPAPAFTAPNPTTTLPNAQNTSICLPPVCDLGCEIDLSVPEGSCAGCKCINETHLRITRQVNNRESKKCAISECSSGCSLVADDNGGCPTCKCGLCIPPKCTCPSKPCQEGCTINNNVPFGHCPTCNCNTRTRSVTTRPRTCTRPECKGANCKLLNEPNGCTRCQCGCIPPNCFCPIPVCTSGCEVDSTVPDGSCPGCLCNHYHPGSTSRKIDNDDDDHDHRVGPVSLNNNNNNNNKHSCAPLLSCTASNCDVAVDQDGCPICECVPICPKRKCDLPCTMVFDPTNEECPKCVCKFDEKVENERKDYEINSRNNPTQKTPKKCLQVSCPDCDTTLGDDGCIVCLCQKENEPSPRCTKSSPTCQGIRCKLVPDGDGCQKCSCEAPCPPLKCEQGCSKVENTNNGRCPYCVCTFMPSY